MFLSFLARVFQFKFRLPLKHIKKISSSANIPSYSFNKLPTQRLIRWRWIYDALRQHWPPSDSFYFFISRQRWTHTGFRSFSSLSPTDWDERQDQFCLLMFNHKKKRQFSIRKIHRLKCQELHLIYDSNYSVSWIHFPRFSSSAPGGQWNPVWIMFPGTPAIKPSPLFISPRAVLRTAVVSSRAGMLWVFGETRQTDLGAASSHQFF